MKGVGIIILVEVTEALYWDRPPTQDLVINATHRRCHSEPVSIEIGVPNCFPDAFS